MGMKKLITNSDINIVIIHGGSASHLDMAPVVTKLSSDYAVTNIDLPGTGNSPWDKSIQNIHDMADCVLKDLPEEAIYIGWSFGGLIAQSLAAKYPNRVRHFIGIATTPKFIAAEDWLGVPAPGFSNIVIPLLQAGKESRDLLKMLYDGEFESFQPKPDRYYQARQIAEKPSTITNELLAKRLEICDATDLRDLFKSIGCPVDFIMGGSDDVIPKQAWENIRNLNPKARIHEIKGAKHAPFWTHPEEFNTILDSIL